jgi:hypothetical protein
MWEYIIQCSYRCDSNVWLYDCWWGSDWNWDTLTFDMDLDGWTACAEGSCTYKAYNITNSSSPTCTDRNFCLNNTIEFSGPDQISIIGPNQIVQSFTLPSSGLVTPACFAGRGPYYVGSSLSGLSCYTCMDCSCTEPLDTETVCAGGSYTGLNGSVLRNSTGFVVPPSEWTLDNSTWNLPKTGNYTVDGCSKEIQVVNCTTPTPTATATATPTGTTTTNPSHYTFSMTNTATRTDENAAKGALMDTAVDNCDNMKTKLESKGWQQGFYRSGSEVTKADFAVNPESGHLTLNSAILHFHVGHGTQPDNDGHTTLQLLDQNNDGYSLSASEVEGLWGGNNKWVILDSCYVMSDNDWAKALGTSHGILGFKTQADVNPRFTERFLYYAIDENKTVYESFARTVYNLYKDTRVPKSAGATEYTDAMVATVIFKDENQAKYDYLPGTGTEIYSGTNSGHAYRYSWLCNQTWKGVV